MHLTPDQLRIEIARRAPWYQSIEFPEYGISTTDNSAHAMLDAAWDNKTNGISLEEAARLRPRPKWHFIRDVLPQLRDLDILEVGSNCGFFSFQFAQMGARTVTGLDVAPHWLNNAEWARSTLRLQNVRFLNCDFMRYDGTENLIEGLFSTEDPSIPLPNRCFDLVFMSTVLDHLFFPLLALYKMLRISRQWVVIDSPLTPETNTNEALARLAVAPDNSHHGFTFSPPFITDYLTRLGIPRNDIGIHPYNDKRNIVYVINVGHLSDRLVGA